MGGVSGVSADYDASDTDSSSDRAAASLSWQSALADAGTGTGDEVGSETTATVVQNTTQSATSGGPQASSASSAPAQPPQPEPQGYVYHQSTGELTHDGQYVATGHSGAVGQGRDNPDMEGVQNVGPVPRGDYTVGPQFNSPNTGPGAERLTPQPGTDTHGRTDLEIHGGRRDGNPDDSEGCIILPPSVRHQLAGQTLHVVP